MIITHTHKLAPTINVFKIDTDEYLSYVKEYNTITKEAVVFCKDKYGKIVESSTYIERNCELRDKKTKKVLTEAYFGAQSILNWNFLPNLPNLKKSSTNESDNIIIVDIKNNYYLGWYDYFQKVWFDEGDYHELYGHNNIKEKIIKAWAYKPKIDF